MFSDTRDRTRNPGKKVPFVFERNETSLFFVNVDETQDDPAEPPRERQRLQLQPRTKPLEEVQPLSGSSSSVNNVAANARQQSIPDESSPSQTSTPNPDAAANEENQQQEFQEGEQSTVKPSRGATASIFGGAKPVDTTARELEIEKKLRELSTANAETSGETEEKRPAPAQRFAIDFFSVFYWKLRLIWILQTDIQPWWRSR